MRKRLLQGIALCAFWIAAGCAPVTVDHDYDPSYDFTGLRTYGWLPGQEGDALTGLTEKRIMHALNEQLRAKGYALSPDAPDFLISLQGTVRTSSAGRIGTGMSVGIPVGRSFLSIGGGKSRERVKQEGTLIIDFLDGNTRQLIWKATAAGAIRQKAAPEEQQQRANEVIAELLKRFPPGVGR